MGTNAQCFIKDTGVCLYQHWDGQTLMNKVVKAVNGIGMNRQNDPSYLTRIIFCEMIKDYDDEELGFGIDKIRNQKIDFLVTVDCENKIITESNKHKVIRTVKMESKRA
jgi:hypothetical protein